MKNNQSGRSMVEMLGVLAIIGVLSAGGLAGYSKAMFKHKLNNTMDQITMLVTNIRTMYGTQGNYAGLTKAVAVDLGIVPAVMTDDTRSGSKGAVTLTNPFKGDVDINETNVNGDHTGFYVEYSGLPNEACIALATADFGSGAGSGFIGTNIDSQTTASGTYGTSTEGNAYAMGDKDDVKGAISLCNATGNVADNHTITWTFY
ncbi:MAG: hypothetical protein IJ830_02550 [Alphaproteobacteria bacterium]|nr:hypothetical protein [Alphaproteobacteria bacterium]